MRCRLLAFAVAGCAYTDVDRPIGLVPHDLPDEWAANLAEAGTCWNLEFGTHFVTGDAATLADQQVDVRFDDATCLQAVSQVQPGVPTMLGICPERYWPKLDGTYMREYITPFRVVSHELGHVVNMLGHPDDPKAVMRGGDYEFLPMFHDVDRQRFIGANPDFATSSPCRDVLRTYRQGTGGRVSHCACEQGELDVTRPIALVPSPQLGPSFADQLALEAGCWNVRYGLSLVVRDPLPGDVRADIDRCHDVDAGVYDGRALDGDSVSTCIYGDATSADWLAWHAVSTVLGVPPAAWSATDAAMVERYHIGVACTKLERPSSSGPCTCAD